MLIIFNAANREAVRLTAVAHERSVAKHAQAVRVGTIDLRTGPEVGVRPETVVAAGVVVAGGKRPKAIFISTAIPSGSAQILRTS